MNRGREAAFAVALLLGLPVFGIWFVAVLGPALILGGIVFFFFVLLGRSMDKEAALERKASLEKDASLKK